MTFEDELRQILNKTSQENASDTPDFILAQYMNTCLGAFNIATRQREKWYGRTTALSYEVELESKGKSADEK